MKLVEMPLDKLKPAAYNPRVELTEDMEEYQALKKSIEEFGDVEPIVWNQRTGNIIGGHQRYNVLKALGYKAAMVSVVDMEEAQEKTLNIALNKVEGEWDEKKLKTVLEELDFEDVQLAGFNMDEVALLMEDDGGFEESMEEALGDAEEYSEDGYQNGISFVITLRFETPEQAQDWAEKEGIEINIKEGTTTTVIRMGE